VGHEVGDLGLESERKASREFEPSALTIRERG
jgi:hypothetical protein